MEEKKENKNEGEEPEVITFKEIVERHKDIKIDELKKLVLICKNCGHKDLLGNFIRKKKKVDRIYLPDDTPKPKPYNPDDWGKPDPFRIPKPPYRFSAKTTNKKIMAIMVDNEEYKDFFYCPKCGSSLIVMDKEFIKNNFLTGMGD